MSKQKVENTENPYIHDEETKNSNENIGINTNKDDVTKTSAEKLTEIVYKPTTIELSEAHLWKQKFQSLEPVKSEEPKDSLMLYVVACCVSILPFCAGIGFSWTSPVLPKLMSPENPLNAPVDASQTSLIASILSIGAAISPVVFGYLADIKGRKKALQLAGFIMTIAFLLLAFATDVRLYYVARLIHGIAIGGNFCVLNMYIAEITENHNRGKFACYTGIFFCLGVLYSFVVGPHLSVKMFSISCAVPLLFFLVLISLVCPETPLYLAKIDDRIQGEAALSKLRYRKSKFDVEKEYEEMRIIAEKESLQTGGCRTLFSTKGLRNAMLVAYCLFIFQNLAGINAVLGFMEDIFASAGGAIPPQYSTVLIGSIQVSTIVVTSHLIEKKGRKFLLLLSFIGCIFCAALLGLYFYLKQTNSSFVTYIWWLPIFSLIIYIITFNLGLGPVPWTILSEIFPASVKSFAAASATTVAFLASFAVTLGFPIMNEFLGMATSFWVFGLCSILGLIFSYFVIPETKGMSLDEIQQYFSK